jgi:hypothetical protein
VGKAHVSKREIAMKKQIFCLVLLFVGILFISASAELTPTGTYEITLSQGSWSTSVTVDLTGKTIDSSKTLVATKNGLNYYMQEVAQPKDNIYAYTWYVQPTVDGNSILKGDGDLTITVTNLTFEEATSDQIVLFEPLVTHIY